MSTNRATRLQGIKDRWFHERLVTPLPSLGVNMADPTTCAEFVVSPRMAFTEDQADFEHFGVQNPKRIMELLSTQFQTIPDGMVDPKVIKDAATVLSVFNSDSEALAARFAPASAHRDEMLPESPGPASLQGSPRDTRPCRRRRLAQLRRL